MSDLQAYDGKTEGVLPGSDHEILRELIAVIDATRDRNIRLTKSGIPPKPLWSAVNERLLWQDPKSILYDWDEVDQVRFIYSLAEELVLIQDDEERLLDVGPGADQFFLATPTRRAELLLGAYKNILQWDERCDARNNQGHRHNFGQTFRRDFKRDSFEVRDALLRGLARAPVGQWVRAEELAIVITNLDPEILVSEDDDAPIVAEGEADPEILRMVEYWVFLAARFGWVDLARTPEKSMDVGGDRLFRLTPLGDVLLNQDVGEVETREKAELAAAHPFVVQPNNDIVFYRRESDVGDEYILRRLAEDLDVTDWDEPTATYHVTAASLARATSTGLEIPIIRRRILERCPKNTPATFAVMLEDVERRQGKLQILRGISAVELDGPSDQLLAELDAAGIERVEQMVLVPWRLWPTFARILGDAAPREGFDYPPEEPLATFKGERLILEYAARPLAARELLDLLDFDDNDSAMLDATVLAELAQQGWTPKAVAEALVPLTHGKLPKRLKSELK